LDVTLLWNGTVFIGAGFDMASNTMTLKARAFSFLARREHTRAELQAKLASHVTEADDLPALLDWLTQHRWLSDSRAAQAFVDTRGKRFGKQKLLFELRQRGVTDDEAKAAVSNLDETQTCLDIWRKKFRAAPTSVEERFKHTRFLLSRGFGSETIRSVLKMIEAGELDLGE
jgi:regulatory protein